MTTCVYIVWVHCTGSYEIVCIGYVGVYTRVHKISIYSHAYIDSPVKTKITGCSYLHEYSKMAANPFALETSPSHYNILNIPRNATSEDVNKAFKKQARWVHPDKSGEHNTESFQRLVHARDTLLNEVKRADYDDEHEDDSLAKAEGALLCGKYKHRPIYILTRYTHTHEMTRAELYLREKKRV